MSDLGHKLLRRFWPGPVTLEFVPPHVGGLTRSLPPATSTAGGFEDGLSIRCPAHDVLQAVLRLLPAPLLLTAERGGLPGASTAAELAGHAGGALSLGLDAGPLRYDQPTSVGKVGESGWEIARESVVTARTLNRLAGTVYLFVCTGNTCRSPMAEALFRRRLAERLGCREDELVDRGYVVASAGVAAGPGEPASEESVEQMRQRGIDLRHHESQPVSEHLVWQADRILTMTRGHRE
ncbi:MAG: Sua5/YciO/YrdC/YwlC family protein, partial [Planctomycetaceae bacterium]